MTPALLARLTDSAPPPVVVPIARPVDPDTDRAARQEQAYQHVRRTLTARQTT